MTISTYRQGVKDGAWAITNTTARMRGKSEFQKKRRGEACSIATMYLTSQSIDVIADGLSLTKERVRQMVRLGISYMVKDGQLRPAASNAEAQSSTSRPRSS